MISLLIDIGKSHYIYFTLMTRERQTCIVSLYTLGWLRLKSIICPAPLFFQYRLFRGRIEVLNDKLKRLWRRLYPREVDIIPATSYPVACTLLDRISIGGNFLKYRFQYPGPSQVKALVISLICFARSLSDSA